MPCTSPLPAWREAGFGGRPNIETGGWEQLDARVKHSSSEIETFRLDCGKCLSCRIGKQRDLAVRAMHQTAISGPERSAFLTLTYNGDHLPKYGSLKRDDLTRFFKRFRKAHGAGLKYIGCGEYGDRGLRPHYHVAIWGHDFPDREKWALTRAKYPGGPRFWLYRSKKLEELWPYGFSWIGALEYESAAYVAGYTVKKLNGSKAFYNYLRWDDDDGLVSVDPEFSTISRGGRSGHGLAHEFFEKFGSDLFPKDHVLMKKRSGMKKVPVPRYYRRLLEERWPELAAELKRRRTEKAIELEEDDPQLRRARDATIQAERRMYGHPDDDERMDGVVQSHLDRIRGRNIPRGDHEALSRDVVSENERRAL